MHIWIVVCLPGEGSIKAMDDIGVVMTPVGDVVTVILLVNSSFNIFGHLVKKLSLRFLKDGLVTELLGETCKRGQFSCVLAA